MNNPEPEHSMAMDSHPWVDLRTYHQGEFQRGRPSWWVMVWWLVQAIVFPLTPHSLHAPRLFLLRLFGAKIGKGVVFRPSARVTFPWKLEIGDDSWIGEDVVLYNLDRICIGRHCVVSQKCYLCTGSHDFTDPTFRLMVASIVLGNGVWIATDCFIAPGVIIGANTVVGARSSVFKSLPEAQVCWGTPCHPRYPRTMC